MAVVTANPVQPTQDSSRNGPLANDEAYNGMKLPTGLAPAAVVAGAVVMVVEEVQREAERQRKEQEEAQKRAAEILAQLQQGKTMQTPGGVEQLRSALQNGLLDGDPKLKAEAQSIVEYAESNNMLSPANTTRRREKEKEQDGRSSTASSSSTSSSPSVGERALTSLGEAASSLVRAVSRGTTPT